MHKALVNLMIFKRDNENNWVEFFIHELRMQSDLGKQLDSDRRVVNRYFANIAEMRMNDLIDIKTARMLTNYRGLNGFYDLVTPLNRAKYGNEPHYEHIFRTLKRVRKRYESHSNAIQLRQTDELS
jgi:hypothetical protein